MPKTRKRRSKRRKKRRSKRRHKGGQFNMGEMDNHNKAFHLFCHQCGKPNYFYGWCKKSQYTNREDCLLGARKAYGDLLNKSGTGTLKPFKPENAWIEGPPAPPFIWRCGNPVGRERNKPCKAINQLPEQHEDYVVVGRPKTPPPKRRRRDALASALGRGALKGLRPLAAAAGGIASAVAAVAAPLHSIKEKREKARANEFAKRGRERQESGRWIG
jgi:hypothetical protein